MWWTARGEQSVPEGFDWLDPRELRRLSGHRFTKRRNEYLLRRWVGKQAAAQVLGLPLGATAAGRLAALNRPGGAPYLELDGAPCGYELSLTDRAGWAVALVAPEGTLADGQVGVDLELVEPRSDGFVDDFLTAAEAAAVRSAPDRHLAANLYWSAKEAALKVQRVGLRADTRSVQITPSFTTRADGWRSLSVAAGDDRFGGWWRADGRFVLSVVTRNPTDPPVALPGCTDLATAEPTHSWMTNPLAD